MSKTITIEEKRNYIKKTNEYYNHWSDDNWLVKGDEYSEPDKAGISTEVLYRALTYEEPDRIEYLKDGKVIHTRTIK